MKMWIESHDGLLKVHNGNEGSVRIEIRDVDEFMDLLTLNTEIMKRWKPIGGWSKVDKKLSQKLMNRLNTAIEDLDR